MKNKKNGIALYVVIALSVMLTLAYDTFQPRSIETVAVISGLGIEAGDEDNVKLSVQIMKSNSPGGEEGNSASGVLMSAEGATVAQACEALVSKVGGVLFWSHCAVIIIDKAFANDNDMVQHLDMFFRSTDFRNTSAVIVYDGSPSEVLNANTVSETVSAFGIRKMMDDQGYETNCIYTTLKRFVLDYYSLSKSTLVTGLEVEESGGSDSAESTDSKGSQQASVVLGRSAVFKEGRFVSYVDEDAFNGYLWLTDTMMARTVVLEDIVLESENNMVNTIGFKLFGASVKAVPDYESGEYILSLQIKANGEIISVKNEMQSSNLPVHRLDERYRELAQELAKSIREDVNFAWDSMAQLDSDYCGIEDMFYSYLGHKWDKDMFETAGDMLDNIRLEFDMDLTVISGGLNKRYQLN